MLKIVLWAVAFLAGTVLLVVFIGYLLPKKHVASRSITLHQRPEDVFRLISDFKAAPSWRSDVQEVELLPPVDGHTHYREKGANGGIAYEIVELTPPTRMVSRIDPGLPFGGAWIFDVSPAPEGCRLNITERGEIYNPVFRFVSRFFLGYRRTLDSYLTNVGRKFGEASVPQEGTAATL
jgi:hypothetical protein